MNLRRASSALFSTRGVYVIGVVAVAIISVVVAGVAGIGPLESTFSDEEPINNVTVDGGGVTVSFVENHDVDTVAIRHEYDEPFEQRDEIPLTAGTHGRESAPRFGGNVTFDTGVASFFCTDLVDPTPREFPTDTFVVAALDGTTVRNFDTIQTVEIVLDTAELNC